MMTLAFYFTANRLNWFIGAAVLMCGGAGTLLGVGFLVLRKPKRMKRDGFQVTAFFAAVAIVLGGFATLIIWGVQSDWNATRNKHITIAHQLARDYRSTVAKVHSTDLNRDHAQDTDHNDGVVYYRTVSGKECSADLHEDNVVGWTIRKPHCATYEHGNYPGAVPK